MTVRIQSDHTIVDIGPYQLIRHPSYTDLLLTMIGTGLVLQSAVGLLINILVFAIVFGYRIYVEERALKSTLGERYVSYSKRTCPTRSGLSVSFRTFSKMRSSAQSW